MKVSFFFSGRGSNMEKIISTSKLPGSKIVPVGAFCDQRYAGGIIVASQGGIKNVISDPHKNIDIWCQRIHMHLEQNGTELIVLAGFMRKLPAWFVKIWKNKIVNIHPSLLPEYRGLNTHARAIADFKSISGTTVHVVDEGLDTGEIIAQVPVRVYHDDTVDILAERILYYEHLIYPRVVQGICSGDIVLTDDGVSTNLTDEFPERPLVIEDFDPFIGIKYFT